LLYPLSYRGAGKTARSANCSNIADRSRRGQQAHAKPRAVMARMEAEPPLIKSENRVQEAQVDQILMQVQVMSRETMAAWHGMSYADERGRMREEG
jgi:hypothetical protein